MGVMASSFEQWFRGTSAAGPVASSTSFQYAYRGFLGVPAKRPATAHLVSTAGGASVGGAAVAVVSVIQATSGGWTLGGRIAPTLSTAPRCSGGVAFGGRYGDPEVGYHIYTNDGNGGPVDYTAPISLVYGARWTSSDLAAGATHRFGVRAFYSRTNLEERNLDAAVCVVLDAAAKDVSRTPPPPFGLRAIPLADGRVRIEWTCPGADRDRRPDQFYVYIQKNALTDYTSPAAVLALSDGFADSYSVELDGLTDSAHYVVGVRAGNASGFESNTNVVAFYADSTPPACIDGLIAALAIAEI